MSRIIQQEQRDNVRQTKSADALILQNERTGETVSLPRDASAWQRREAIKQLQPARDTTYDQPLVPKAAAKPDKPLPVPTTPGILARKRAQENAEFERQREKENSRRREIEDRKSLASDIIEGLKNSGIAAEPIEPPRPDLGEVYKQRLEATAALVAARKSGDAAAIAAAETTNRAAWGFADESPAAEGGSDE